LKSRWIQHVARGLRCGDFKSRARAVTICISAKSLPRNAAKGFTLLEILAVMLIIAIVMSIAIPRFGDVFQTNVKGAMRKFTGMVKFCFHESVIKQTHLRLMIDPVKGEYWPTLLATSGSVGQFVSLTGSDVISKKGKLPNGIRFIDVVTPHNIFKIDKDEAFIAFYPTGFVERSVIHLGDDAGRFYTLVTQPLTGDMEVLDGYVDIADTNQFEGPFSLSQSGNQ